MRSEWKEGSTPPPPKRKCTLFLPLPRIKIRVMNGWTEFKFFPIVEKIFLCPGIAKLTGAKPTGRGPEHQAQTFTKPSLRVVLPRCLGRCTLPSSPWCHCPHTPHTKPRTPPAPTLARVRKKSRKRGPQKMTPPRLYENDEIDEIDEKNRRNRRKYLTKSTKLTNENSKNEAHVAAHFFVDFVVFVDFFRRFLRVRRFRRFFSSISSISSISFRRFRRFRRFFSSISSISKNSTEKCLAYSGAFGVDCGIALWPSFWSPQ